MSDRPLEVAFAGGDAEGVRRVEADLAHYPDVRFRLEAHDDLQAPLATAGGAQPDALLVAARLVDPVRIESLRDTLPETAVVALTGAESPSAVALLRAGAQDCFPADQIGGGALAQALHFAVERARATRPAPSAEAEQAPTPSALGRLAAVVVHDLNEPLRVIVEYCRMLGLHSDGLGASAERYLERVSEAAHRLQLHLASLNEYARAGTRQVARHPTACSDVVQSAIGNLKLAIDESGAQIGCESLPTLSVDAVQLAQVFQNLIANAIKFRGDQSPEIRISAVREGDVWIFSVADNGRGIDPAEGERIFELFHRGKSTQSVSGSGVGLAIARMVVQAHGGRIWAEPNPAGGSAIRFSLRVG